MQRRTLLVFGTALDALESLAYVERKLENLTARLAGLAPEPPARDPYDALLPRLREKLGAERVMPAGKVPVDEWLQPIPPPDPLNLPLISLSNYEAFTDSNGARTYADQVRDAVSSPEGLLSSALRKAGLRGGTGRDEVGWLPVMVGVDHSATGGVVEALSERYGRDELGLVVLDYHADFRPTGVTYGMNQWDSERRGLPYLLPPRPDTYNAGTFLYHLLENGVVEPGNLTLLGVVEYPTRKLREVRDPRVQAYVELYDRMEAEGVQIVRNSSIRRGLQDVEKALSRMEASHIYVSFDSDVGVLGAIHATRLLNFGPKEIPLRGLDSQTLLSLALLIGRHLQRHRIGLAGVDITETDIHLVNRPLPGGGRDRTLQVESDFTATLLRSAGIRWD